MTAQEWLDRADALAAATLSSPPWLAERDNEPMPIALDYVVYNDVVGGGGLIATVDTGPDARFIAAARTDWPKANAALRAVLARHRPGRAQPDSDWLWCVECGNPFPCATRGDVTAALGVVEP